MGNGGLAAVELPSEPHLNPRYPLPQKATVITWYDIGLRDFVKRLSLELDTMMPTAYTEIPSEEPERLDAIELETYSATKAKRNSAPRKRDEQNAEKRVCPGSLVTISQANGGLSRDPDDLEWGTGPKRADRESKFRNRLSTCGMITGILGGALTLTRLGIDGLHTLTMTSRLLSEPQVCQTASMISHEALAHGPDAIHGWPICCPMSLGLQDKPSGDTLWQDRASVHALPSSTVGRDMGVWVPFGTDDMRFCRFFPDEHPFWPVTAGTAS